DERLAGVPALTNDEVAEVALLRLLAVRLQLLLTGPGLEAVPDRVAGLRGEPAVLELEHLVPAARLVEPEHRALGRLGEGVLHLVAVVELRRRRDNRLERRRDEPSEALQRVG